jgi:hypothetical protein
MYLWFSKQVDQVEIMKGNIYFIYKLKSNCLYIDFSCWGSGQRLLLFNAIMPLSTMSVISWQSVLLVEKTGENHRPTASHWQTY